jgi:hypothetical protein
MGKREASIGWIVPVFLPEGNYQNELYMHSVNYLKDAGFTVMDIRDNGYENSIISFKLKWPELSGKYPSVDEFNQMSEGIACYSCLATSTRYMPRYALY